MKLIEKKAAEPQLIWGAKYKVLEDGYFRDIAAGETVVLTMDKPDDDGDVEAHSKEGNDYFKPHQLQLISVVDSQSLEVEIDGRYIATGTSWGGTDLTGKTVIVYDHADGDGDVGVRVVEESKMYRIKPEQLKPVAEIAAETVYTVELTETELQELEAALGITSEYNRADYAGRHGLSGAVGSLGQNLYKVIKHDILGGSK